MLTSGLAHALCSDELTLLLNFIFRICELKFSIVSVCLPYLASDILILLIMIGIFQVPRSTKKLYEDNEYALYTVTLFNRVADNFRTSAREKGFQVSLFYTTYMMFLFFQQK